MRKYWWHWITIASMSLIGIGIFLFSLFTSNPTNPGDEIEDRPQLSERYQPQISRRVRPEKRISEDSLDLVSHPTEESVSTPVSTADLTEEQEVTSSPLPNSEEDEITVKIQELEAQYANYYQQRQVLYEQRVEVTKLRHAHDGHEGMLRSKAQMDEVYRQMIQLAKDGKSERNKAEINVLKERIQQIMNEFNAEARALGDMSRMLQQEIETLAAQMNAIESELAYLKSSDRR